MDNKSNIFIDIEKKGNGAKQAKDEVKDLKKNVQDINKTLSFLLFVFPFYSPFLIV